MNPQDSSPFFSSSQMQSADNPLSAAGRFGRLSAIGWYGFIHLVTFFALFAFNLAIGLFNLNTRSLNYDFIQLFNSLAGLGFIVIMVVYFYFLMVVSVRRLHDMNRGGWLIILFIIPLLNVFLGLYLMFGSGTAGINRYGLPRDTAIWEKILAWLIIIMTVLSLLASGSFVSYMMDTTELKTPQEVIQKGTEYF
ncbi:DUF805 domain-containing protein [Acinetobacter albensis]|uniref:DUF805 domain-containing protein n=1 Tax=Acinetobacter albensis TaxID=1673609 RepID=A0ABW9JP24_9GAMM